MVLGALNKVDIIILLVKDVYLYMIVSLAALIIR